MLQQFFLPLLFHSFRTEFGSQLRNLLFGLLLGVLSCLLLGLLDHGFALSLMLTFLGLLLLPLEGLLFRGSLLRLRDSFRQLLSLDSSLLGFLLGLLSLVFHLLL